MSGEALLPRTSRRLVLAWIPLAAAAIAGVYVSAPTRSSGVSAASLLPASLLRTRGIEARVSGLAWAPFVPPSATSEDAADRTRGDASDVLQERRDGLVQLLIGDPRDAVAALEKASAANEPAVWSDLAAAYYEASVRHDAPHFLADALAAVDRALAAEPDRAEALFNRALVLERLGLRIDARTAWSRYLAIDSETGWADEARKHHHTLEPEPPFDQVLDAEYDRVGRDPAAAAALYARDRFGARRQGVVEVLGRWAHAILRGDERDAVRHLNVARQLGRVVAGGGDRLLEQSVAAIDRAGDRGAFLARAHTDFYAGMKLYHQTKLADAEPLLRRAAAALQQAGSPMAVPASLWAANCVYEQGRRDEARHQYETLLATTSAEFPAYRGFIFWQLANCRNARGEWGAAITLFEQSVLLFERIGETGNVANVRQLLAAVHDRIGDRDAAWKNRLASLHGLGIRTNEVYERTVWALAEAAIVRRDWHMASSFLKVYIDVQGRLRNDVELATARLLRAVVHDRLGDAGGVRDDLAEARRIASRVEDPSYQEMLRATEWRSVAMLRSTPPATAGELLTRAIDYESARGRPSTLPALLLLRARARREAANLAGARADIEQGIQQMERHRESLPAGAARWGAFHAAEELFDEGVDAAMTANDHKAAFRITEKARARSLLDSYGATPEADLRALPPRTVVVEYATLPSALVIFVADVSGVHAVRVNVTREALAAGVHAFIEAIQDPESSETLRHGAALYAHLVQPIASRLTGASTVVFVPNDVTATVPFAALADARGDYLLRHHAIVVAPSTAAYIVANERRHTSAPRSALIVTASAATASAGSLRFTNAEAKRILRHYRTTSRIDEASSQWTELIERARDADVIHFGGHAVGDARGYEPASIVLRDGGEERRVGVAEIARLRLDRTAVVVLAGCGTARGQRRAAEGVISVAHGFLSAGVPSAVATLWPISDEASALFFPRLHEKLAAGMSAAEALRAVQLEAIQRGDIPASLWAAVQVMGS